MSALGIALAVLVGLSLGLLGAGGSILTVPIFVYALGYATKSAIAMSLAVVGEVSLVGAFRHWRAGNVQLRMALVAAMTTVPGSFLGARLAGFLSDGVQLVLFAVVMLLAAILMLRPARARESEPMPELRGRALTQIGILGLFIGVLTGVVGVGGGFLIVPALMLLGGVPMKPAVGTSLLVIALNSGAALSGYLGQVPIAWVPTALFAAAATGGILLGARLARFVPAARLQRAFTLVLIGMGGFILCQNRAVLLPQRQAPAMDELVISTERTSNERVIR